MEATKQYPLAGVFCDAIDIKEKKARFYGEWAEKCDDPGKEAFIALKEAELKDLDRLKAAMSQKISDGVCAYIPEKVPVSELVMKKVPKGKRNKDSLCKSLVEPFDMGIQMEDQAITVFRKYLGTVAGEEEKAFLEAFIAEEMEHRRLLENMKYYYQDPEGWFMEKGKSGLDGA